MTTFLSFSNALRRLVTKCNTLISTSFSDKYLIYTNMGISVLLSGVGDIIEQNYEILTHEQENWDPTRTRNMSASGLVIGMFCHHWYNFLDRQLPGYTLRTVMKKVVFDQFICSPVCITTLFVTVGMLEGRSREEVLAEIKQKFVILYTAEWVVWPPAQFINFYLLPHKYRVLYDNTISLGYDIYTSYVKNVIPANGDNSDDSEGDSNSSKDKKYS